MSSFQITGNGKKDDDARFREYNNERRRLDTLLAKFGPILTDLAIKVSAPILTGENLDEFRNRLTQADKDFKARTHKEILEPATSVPFDEIKAILEVLGKGWENHVKSKFQKMPGADPDGRKMAAELEATPFRTISKMLELLTKLSLAKDQEFDAFLAEDAVKERESFRKSLMETYSRCLDDCYLFLAK